MKHEDILTYQRGKMLYKCVISGRHIKLLNSKIIFYINIYEDRPSKSLSIKEKQGCFFPVQNGFNSTMKYDIWLYFQLYFSCL